MNKMIAGAALSVWLLIAGGLSPAAADGAITVGTTSNVVKDGVAFGTAINYESDAEARKRAIEFCHKFKGAPKAAAECMVAASFKDECYAIAMDPKAGTPGVGWAIAATKAIAEERAIAGCQVMAGRGRRGFCKIEESKCDGGTK
jgi:hypothetical protein